MSVEESRERLLSAIQVYADWHVNRATGVHQGPHRSPSPWPKVAAAVRELVLAEHEEMCQLIADYFLWRTGPDGGPTEQAKQAVLDHRARLSAFGEPASLAGGSAAAEEAMGKERSDGLSQADR